MIHEKYFKLPLTYAKGYPSMVFEADNGYAFDVIGGISPKDIISIINKLNGTHNKTLDNKISYNDEGYVIIDGERAIMIRSWGRLTGGTNRLSLEKATEIQDSFGKWIVKKLKE